MKKWSVFILFFVSLKFFACDCPPLQKINAELIEKYNVIFLGKIDSISSCSKEGIAKAYFTIKELYKGQTTSTTAISFDCKSSCMMNFEKGEEWLIYAKYGRFEVLITEFCEHSRKYFQDETQDTYYTLVSHQTFEEEINYLKSNLGTQSFIEKNKLNEQQQLLRPHNEQPSATKKVVLVLISIVVMGLIYFFTRKKKRK